MYALYVALCYIHISYMLKLQDVTATYQNIAHACNPESDYETIMRDPLLLGSLLGTRTVDVPKGCSVIILPNDQTVAIHT